MTNIIKDFTDEEINAVIRGAKIAGRSYCNDHGIFVGLYEEVEHSAIVYALENIDKIPPPIKDNLKFLVRIVKFRLIDEYRRTSKGRGVEVNETTLKTRDYFEPWARIPINHTQDINFKIAIWEVFNLAMKRFSKRDKDIVKRRVIDQEPGEDVARFYKMKVGTVHSVTSRFKSNFRKLWDERESGTNGAE